MRTGIATAGALAVLLLLSGPARAQEPKETAAGTAAETAAPALDFGRDGFYAGLNFVYAVPYFEDYLENRVIGTFFGDPSLVCTNCTFTVDVDPSVGFNARVGYRFLRHFAVEGQFEWLDEFDVQIKENLSGLGGTDSSTIDGLTATVDLKLYPFTGRLQPYVDLGFGYMELDSRDNETLLGVLTLQTNVNESEIVARFGGGLDFYINETWGMNFAVAYVTPGATLSHFNYTSLNAGFFYRFGAPERD